MRIFSPLVADAATPFGNPAIPLRGTRWLCVSAIARVVPLTLESRGPPCPLLVHFRIDSVDAT